MAFNTQLDVLPQSQRALWAELEAIPDNFVLYGGTAIALRLGHRSSVDFDFFSSAPVDVDRLFADVSCLADSEILQRAPNTLTVSVDRTEPVKISFFGEIGFGRVGSPELTNDGVLRVASLLDLLGTKLKVLLQRIEQKDYLDIEAILRSGVRLEDGLGAAARLYGVQFPPMDCAKTLAYFDEDSLTNLPDCTKKYLVQAVGDWAGKVVDVPLLSDALV